MEKILCRSFQMIMKFGMYLLPWRMPLIIDGEGSIKKLPQKIKDDGFNNILIVAGPTITKLGLLDELFNELEQVKISYTLFNNITANPTDINVEEGVKKYLDNNCEAIIIFGGGSPMDAGKAIAARIARPNKTVLELQGLFKVLAKVPRIYAVPTTAGTGSETTIAAVITDSKTHHKASINDLCLIPKDAILDPTLTINLPKHITATTGMDALCHAVEAYTNHLYNSKLENELCIKAVKLIHDNLLIAYNDGNNLKARQNMQLAAFYAGRAFTRGSVGYVHAIGHTLGGLYQMSHGLAMAILLPKVLRAYGDKVYKHLATLCDICEIKTEDSSIETKALAFIEWIEEINEKMNIPNKIDIIKKEDINTIIDWAKKEANPLYPVPVIWNKKDFEAFLNTLI